MALSTDKILRIQNVQLKQADDIETIICLSVLIFNDVVPQGSDVAHAESYWKIDMEGDCDNCPFHEKCLACIINEQNSLRFKTLTQKQQ